MPCPRLPAQPNPALQVLRCSAVTAPLSSPDVIPLIQRGLLDWYARQGRDLPWRHTNDPYAILVSEIMLQQTQVERVLPKYHEFLGAFPSVATLAAAPRSEVIRRWSPLGYNLRAVRLHQIAQQVVERFGGAFPDTVEQLLELKGIGPYTAGAIACFAFRQRVAFLDTNIRRVLARCLIGDTYPKAGSDKLILALAAAALPADAYAWHQALMDLGATVCRWAHPDCTACPLAEWCRARPLLESHATETAGLQIAEPRPVYRTQPRFTGSRRYYRGRVVEALRALPAGAALPLGNLGPTLKPDYTDADLPWLIDLVTTLATDGLIQLDRTDQQPAAWRIGLG